MRKLLLVLLLSLPVLALPTPEEVVVKLYRSHLKNQELGKTVAQVPGCFTPEFLALLNKALEKRDVDTDLFTHQKSKMTEFELGNTAVQTTQAQVHLQIWAGDRVGQQNRDPQNATIYLVDLQEGKGYQIEDIQFQTRPRFKVADFLKSLVGS